MPNETPILLAKCEKINLKDDRENCSSAGDSFSASLVKIFKLRETRFLILVNSFVCLTINVGNSLGSDALRVRLLLVEIGGKDN